MDTRGAARRWTGSVVARACEGFVTGLPAEAADALVVDAVFLVVSGDEPDFWLIWKSDTGIEPATF